MTFYRALVPALRVAGVETRVIEGSAFYAAEEKAVREFDGVTVETLERHADRTLVGALSRFAPRPRPSSPSRSRLGDVGAGRLRRRMLTSSKPRDWGLLFVPPAVKSTRPLIVQCHGSIGQISVHDPIAGEETQGMLTRLLERAVDVAGGDGADLQPCQRRLLARGGRPRSDDDPAGLEGSRVACRASIGRPRPRRRPRAALEGAASRVRRPGAPGRARSVAGLDGPRHRLGHTRRLDHRSLGDVSIRMSGDERFSITRRCRRQRSRERQRSALFNLVPSTWDVFNFTAVEAMASGRPAIVSTGAGASELIEDGVNGYLFQAGDADALAIGA